VVGLVWIGVREASITLALFVDPTGWGWDLLLGVATAAAMVVAWEGLRARSTLARDLEERLREVAGELTRDEALGLAVLSGVAEEVFFRGALQPTAGYLVATAVFGLLHTGRGRELRLWTLAALVAGAALGGLMAWRGNLLAPIVAHAGVNAVGLSRLRRPPAPGTDSGTEPPDRPEC
jgi:membrane protease YdiL (CAAX protease family)